MKYFTKLAMIVSLITMSTLMTICESCPFRSCDKEHQSTCSEWELLGYEIIKVVENAIDYATPTEIPGDLRLKIDVHARNCVIQQRKRHGLSRSLGVCKLLKQLYIS